VASINFYVSLLSSVSVHLPKWPKYKCTLSLRNSLFNLSDAKVFALWILHRKKSGLFLYLVFLLN